MDIQHNVSQTECKRCGKCCIAGGPTLHSGDRDLIVKGVLGPKDLIVFRKNEIAYDPVSGSFIRLEKELIKIKGKNDIGECKFFKRKESICAIYKNRPIECRVLKCWDTKDLEAILMKDLLSRNDIMPETSLLWEIVDSYERKFDLALIQNNLESLPENSKKSFLRDIIQKDFKFRLALSKKFDLTMEDLKFFLGRPISDIFSPLLTADKNE